MEQSTNKYTIPLAIIVAGGLIAMAIYYGGASPQLTANNQPGSQADIVVPPVTSNDHLLGNPNAQIKLVEYSDTECPFCKVFHGTVKQVLATYPDQVALVYRHFPIAQLHSRAPKEAEALECVAELGGETAFWKYLDEVFATTNSNDTLDPTLLPKIASDVGVNVTAFNSCLSSGKYTNKINESIAEAIKAGARGTPYSVLMVNGEMKAIINGAEPFDSVKAKIDTLLK